MREITQGWSPENVWDMVKPGSVWRSLPGTSLNKKDDGDLWGRKAGQAEAHVGFFVNAASVKEDPIVIGKYAKPRCFNNLKNMKRLYGCWYYARPKAWMNT